VRRKGNLVLATYFQGTLRLQVNLSKEEQRKKPNSERMKGGGL
jgi:hypothetical protein